MSQVYLICSFVNDENQVANTDYISTDNYEDNDDELLDNNRIPHQDKYNKYHNLKEIDHLRWWNYTDRSSKIAKFNAKYIRQAISKEYYVDSARRERCQSRDSHHELSASSVTGHSMNLMNSHSDKPETKVGNYNPKENSYLNDERDNLIQKRKEIHDDRHIKSEYETFEIKETFKRISIEKYTVMLLQLPEAFRNHKILDKFMRLLYPGKVQKVFMAYETEHLIDIHDEIDYHQEELEKICKENDIDPKLYTSDDLYYVDSEHNDIMKREKPKCIFFRLPCRCGKKRNMIIWHQKKIKKLKEKFMKEKERVFKQPPAPCAFVVFNNLVSATHCVSTPIRFGLTPVTVKKAPVPDDVIWEHLYYDKKSKSFRNFIATVIFLALLLFWSIPISAVQALANLEYIFNNLFNTDPKKILSADIISIIEGSLSVYILTIFMAILPYICRWITKIQKIPSRGEQEVKILKKYFVCLVVMIMLITALAGTLFASFDSFKKNYNKIVTILTQSLSNMSTYFMIYVLFYVGIYVPLLLLRPTYWIKSALQLQPDPEITFGYVRWYAKTMLILLVCITYSILSPLIWVVGFFYFIVSYFVFSYTLTMNFIPQYEFGATVWPHIYGLLTKAFNIVILTWLGTFALKKRYIIAGLIVPLFVIVNYARQQLELLFDDIYRSASVNAAQAKDQQCIVAKKTISEIWCEADDLAYYPSVLRKKYDV